MRAFLAPARPRPGTRVGALYEVPLDGLGEAELEDERRRLTLQPRVAFGAPPPPIVAYEEADGMLRVPRFYGLERYGPAEVDARVDGEPIALSFTGELTPVQRRAWDAVRERELHPERGGGGVMISLPCGFGKTVLSTFMIAAHGRKTCVLVHKGVIRDQWKECLERFCPGVRVGFVQGKVWQVEGYDVVIAMVMTLAKRRYDPATFDCFGQVFADEAHHMAAPVTNLAMRQFRARRVVALTATKDRPDGMTPLLHWLLGPEGFHVEREGEKVRVSIATYRGGCREVLSRDGKPLMAVMLNQLARHPGRNAFLADRIAALRALGRVVMVFSDRIEQLRTLRALVAERGVPAEEIGLFEGATREADRAAQLARPVVMCSYQMANEGVDKKEADTCVMATPKARVVQCIGRVQRPCAHKQTPLVVDVADDVSVFVPLRWKRQRLYSQERYAVQVLPHDADAAAWFA